MYILFFIVTKVNIVINSYFKKAFYINTKFKIS